MTAYLPPNSVIVNPGYQKIQGLQQQQQIQPTQQQIQMTPQTTIIAPIPNSGIIGTAPIMSQSQSQPQPQPTSQQFYTNAQPYVLQQQQQSQFPQFQYVQQPQPQHHHRRQVDEQRQQQVQTEQVVPQQHKIQMTSNGQYIPTYPTGPNATRNLYDSRTFVPTSQAMKVDIDPNVKSEKIWEHRTILYSKDDFAFYFSEYGSLTAFWFLTWLGCLLARTNTTLMNTINGEFWAAIVAACIAFAMIFILICINQVEHTGPVALIVFLIYWACFSFVVMYLTAWIPTWVIFQIISLLFGTSLTLLIALLVTSFTRLEDMKATALGGLVILYTLIILICALTASSESAVTILMATIVELAVAAWMVWDANNIAAKRYALMLVLDRSRMAPVDKMLDDAMDATSGSLRLFMNLIGSPLFFIDLCDQNSEKKKEEKKKKEEERKKNKKDGHESDTESDDE